MGLFDQFKKPKVETPETRRQKNNEYIKKMGIACLEELPTIEERSDVYLKDLDTICKRAVACLLAIQLAWDIQEQNDYDESKQLFSKLLKEYDVENELLDKEKKLFNGTYNEQDAIDIVWTYETYWAIVWALGLIDDNAIKVPNQICDYMTAIKLVGDCQ